MGGDLLGGSEIVQAKERSLSEGRGSGDRNRGHVIVPANTCNTHACQALPHLIQTHNLSNYPIFQMCKQRHREANRTCPSTHSWWLSGWDVVPRIRFHGLC